MLRRRTMRKGSRSGRNFFVLKKVQNDIGAFRRRQQHVPTSTKTSKKRDDVAVRKKSGDRDLINDRIYPSR